MAKTGMAILLPVNSRLDKFSPDGALVWDLDVRLTILQTAEAWNLQQLPADWREQRRRWDRFNVARVILIASAFLALVLSYRTLFST
jgi:hypothetical protein